MRVAVVGASGRTGKCVVREALERGYGVSAVCRNESAGKLDEFAGREGFALTTAPVVSDEAMLMRALGGCDGVVATLFSVRRLRATEMVASLAKACAAHGIKRLSFTAGEVTTVREQGEAYTVRQCLLRALSVPISLLTPYSVLDMIRASKMVAEQPDWEWAIVRAPTLRDTQPTGYRLCKLSEVNASHALSREDYAACLLDRLSDPDHQRRRLTVVPKG